MTTRVEPLFNSGIGIVIDNKVNDPASGDAIIDLLKQIDEAGIPRITYTAIPPETNIRRFSSAGFILLDWELWEKPNDADMLAGATTGNGEIERLAIAENIAFLKSLKNICFVPVFVFSHLAPAGIKRYLTDAGLLQTGDDSNFILICQKNELTRSEANPRPLVDTVNKWVCSTPAVYVLTKWREAVICSQNRLFWDLYGKDPTWPRVLWETYKNEGDDPEHGLADILIRNMRARLQPLALQPDFVVPPAAQQPDRATTQAVLETSMVVPNGSLPSHQYGCGDIFKGSRQRYWINIRCDCDCLARDDRSPDDVQLYLLEARIMKDADFVKAFDKEKNGLIQTNATSHILFPLEGNALRIGFGHLCQVKVGDLTKKNIARIGRLTAPYITQLRQRFALHLQREGLPRIPNAAVPDITPASPVSVVSAPPQATAPAQTPSAGDR